MCAMKSGSTRLLLSGHDLGHPVDCQTLQTCLAPVFDGEPSSEMGASALRELQRYVKVLNKIKGRMEQEESALKWATLFEY